MHPSPDAAIAPPLAYVSPGGLVFRRLLVPDDIPMIHGWFQQPHAAFWCLQGASVAEVRELYVAQLESGFRDVHIGALDGEPVVLAESYDPRFDQLADHYAVQPGDLGMHICVAPARHVVHGFSRRVFRAVMDLMFDGLGARRVVVEPDRHNARIHTLNKTFGFVYRGDVQLREKVASLALCTRDDYRAALLHLQEIPA
ncbi:GNAT family N-acetyltransferase [Roseateles chitosanitabidus]|uniref:GNAT family N-acetyltransferase n=1 Tax=Roseateles chitosanitabidus TaxID=65048 RepID=UPI00082D8332|nr:GNAT family N-acetyltransferase [Roseateles chitosanitabidus]